MKVEYLDYLSIEDVRFFQGLLITLCFITLGCQRLHVITAMAPQLLDLTGLDPLYPGWGFYTPNVSKVRT